LALLESRLSLDELVWHCSGRSIIGRFVETVSAEDGISPKSAAITEPGGHNSSELKQIQNTLDALAKQINEY